MTAFKSQILFINKKRHSYFSPYEKIEGIDTTNKSSGLANSVSMVVEMLTEQGIDANLEEVVDNNCIDRVVTKYRPRIVVIEALWVVPEKFHILCKLHPTVQWIVRLHSEITFLSNEGSSMGWLKEYAKHYPNLIIAANSKITSKDLTILLRVPVIYLPNYYITENNYGNDKLSDGIINVSCFGAIRPLKNQLIQAIAAIKFANECKKQLRFHINGTRIEGRGESIHKNIVSLFKGCHHQLIEHPWYPHNDFKKLIREEIDIGMQVSLTESYNIVAADHIDCNVPIVTSPEVKFVWCGFRANPTNVNDIVFKLRISALTKIIGLHKLNNLGLWLANQDSIRSWMKLFKN